MQFFLDFLKGIIIGIGKVIPGVSGAILATSLGVYEKGLEILSHLKTELLKNIKFVFSIGLGILISMVFGSKLILICLDKYYLITMLCFIGMIIGGIKPIVNKNYKYFNKKNFLIFFISFFAIMLLSIINIKGDNDNVFTYFLSGISEAISTIVPGISGTALLMMIGTYGTVMTSFANLFNFSHFIENITVLLPFIFGMIIGVIIISKIINYLFKKYKTNTYFAIIGFSLASIVLIFIQTLGKRYSILEILLSFVSFIVGYFITIKISE